MLPVENIEQYCQLKSCIQHLDNKIEELDFGALINFLEEQYEKPLLQVGEKKEENKQLKDQWLTKMS